MSNPRYVDIGTVLGAMTDASMFMADAAVTRTGNGIPGPDMAGAVDFIRCMRRGDAECVAPVLQHRPGFGLLVGMTQLLFEVGMLGMGEEPLWRWLDEYAAELALDPDQWDRPS